MPTHLRYAQLFTSPQPPAPLWHLDGQACVSLEPWVMMTADKHRSPLLLQVGANADILDRAL
jgi:hypothetical protein